MVFNVILLLDLIMFLIVRFYLLYTMGLFPKNFDLGYLCQTQLGLTSTFLSKHSINFSLSELTVTSLKHFSSGLQGCLFEVGYISLQGLWSPVVGALVVSSTTADQKYVFNNTVARLLLII